MVSVAAAQTWIVPHAAWFYVIHGTWLELTGQLDRLEELPTVGLASRKHLALTEALQPAITKLLLASCTWTIVWLLLGLVWLLLCKAWWLVGTIWWLLCWPWVNLVWKPSLYLQVGGVFRVQQGLVTVT
jgi:hypothetical protein